MAWNFDPKVSAKQTAYKGACDLAAALVTAGLVDSEESAMATMEKIAGQIFSSLEESIAEAPVRQAESTPAAAPDSPGEFVINFGKHKGKTVAQVVQEDMDYITWLTEKDWNKARDKARNFAKAHLDSVKAGV